MYAACLIFAAILLLTMFLGKTHTYIQSYSLESITSRNVVPHRFPDFIYCPAKRVLRPPMSFNVWYDPKFIDRLRIENDEVEAIIQLYYDRCYNNLENGCEAMKTECPQNLKGTCDRMKRELKLVETNASRFKIDNIRQKLKMDVVQKTTADYGISPFLLWLLVTDFIYPPFWKQAELLYGHMKDPHPGFWFYRNGRVDKGLVNQTYKVWHNIWLEKTLCSVIRGSKLPLVETPYFGVTRHTSRDRYWIGHLETMKVSDQSFTTRKVWSRIPRVEGFVSQDRLSSIAYYAMTRLEEPIKTSDCTKQPILSGIKNACPTQKARWYYDLSFNTARSLTSIWIYPTSVTKIFKVKTYSLYTQIEIAVGFFGSCIGISIFQIIELGFGAIKLKFHARMAAVVLKWILYVLVIISASIVTATDTISYFQNSVSTEFRTKPEINFTVPLIKICNRQEHRYSFWNVTKFHELNVSLETAGFIREFSWLQKHSSPTHLNTVYSLTENKRTNKQETNSLNGLIVRSYQARNLNFERFRELNISIDKGVNFTEFWPCVKYEDKDNDISPSLLSCLTMDKVIKNPMIQFIDQENLMAYFQKDKRHNEFYARNRVIELEQELFSYGSNIDEKGYTIFTRKIVKEISRISRAIGKGKGDPYLMDITQAFLPDPKVFLTCFSRGIKMEDCGLNFEVYMENLGGTIYGSGACLVLKPKPNFNPIKDLGLAQGLQLIFDSEEFKKHSDAVQYFGPGTFEDTMHHLPLGSCVDGDYKCARSFTSFDLKLFHPYGGFSSETIKLEKMGEELGEVYLGIQMQIRCNCVFCPHRRNPFMRHLKFVMGEAVQCCTAENMVDCYLRYAKDVGIKSDGSYDLNSPVFAPRALPLWIGRYEGSISSWRAIINTTMLNGIFTWPYDDTERLPLAVKQRFIDFISHCMKPQCVETSIQVASVQKLPPIDFGKKDRFLLFYGSPDSEGIEEFDRLDPALLLGAMSCAYSFTFGIGVVGVLEVLVNFLLVSFWRGGRSLQNIAQWHLVRSFTVWSKSTEIVQPEKDLGSECSKTEGRNHVSRPDKSHSVQPKPDISPQSKNDNSGNVMVDLNPNLPSMVRRRFSSSFQNDLESDGRQPTQDPSTSKNSEIVNENQQQIGTRTNEKHEQEKNEQLKRVASVMWIFVPLGASFVVGFTWWFMSRSFFLIETTLDIQSRPVINLPSVAICTGGKATRLIEFIGQSQCRVRKGKLTDCSKRFNNLVGREKKTRNTTDVGKLEPGDTCLLLRNKETLKPRVIPEESCQHFIYDVAITKNTEAKGKTKSLKLSVSREMMTVRTERSKFGLADGFSILGGVIGSILEITLLNIIAVCVVGIGLFKGCIEPMLSRLTRSS